MIKHYLILVASALCFSTFGQTVQGTYTTNTETVTFDSADDGQTHGLFDPSTEPNPYSINDGYSLPTLWNGGNVPTYTDQFVLGPQFPSIPSFGCSSIPGASTILDFLGLDCSDFDFPGFSMSGGIIFDMTATAELDIDFVGFGEDSLRIVYPAAITTESPLDNTYNSGDWISLSTSSDLNQSPAAGARLDTYYPDEGHIEGWLDFDIQTDVSLGFNLNIFGLNYNLSYPIISVGLADFLENTIGLSDSRFPIYKVDSTMSYCWGEVNFFDPLNLPQPGWFPNLPGPLQSLWYAFPQCSWPYDQIPNYCGTAQFYDDQLPLDISSGPISGQLDLPNVQTTTTLYQDAMNAYGFDEYTRVDLSIPDLVAMIISNMPCGCLEPPAVPATVCPDATTAACVAAREAIVYALEHLTFDASFDLPGFDDDLEISWALFTATIGLVQENRLNVDFNPTIYGRYDLPVPVDYKIYDSLGTQYTTGQGSVINYTVGDSVLIKYPCHYTELAVDRAYNIDGQVHTTIGDSYSLQFAMTAGGVAFQIPGFNLFPGFTFSESIPYPDVCWSEECCCGICVDIPYPCISYYDLTVTFPSVTIPTISFNTCEDLYSLIPGVDAIDFPTNNNDTGDCDENSGAMVVYEQTLLSADQLGLNFPYWYENTWSFEGFAEEYGSTLILKAKGMSATATTTDIACNGASTGAINVTVTNGSPTITYAWTGSNGYTNTSQNISSLPEGEYFLTITDGNGCETVTGGTVVQPDPLVLSAGVIDADCFNAGTGSINVLISGGVGGYTFDWDTDGTGDYNDPEDLNALTAGVYNVSIHDANNCTITGSYTITEPTALQEGSAAITTDASCFSGSDGSIDVNIVGGTQPYTFDWSNDGTGDNDDTEDLVDLAAGNYVLNVIDARGCQYSNNYNLAEPTDIQLSSVASAVDCYGNNTGSVDVSVIGGTPGYTYQWFNQSGGMSSTTTEDAFNLFAGDHIIVVTDTKGCKDTLSTTVTQPDELIISNVVIQNLDCYGVAIGAIDITADGGIVGTYNYNWTTTDGSGVIAPDEDQTGLGAGTYTVDVTDVNNCLVSDSYTVTEPAQPLSATYTVVDVKCFGDATGGIDLAVAGGTAPYSFNWTTAGGSGLVAAGEDQLDLTAGTYDVDITDSKGCMLNVSIVVSEPLQPLALSETHADVLCYGGNSGSIDLTITGGTAPYTHEWSNSASILLTQTTEDLNNLPSDTFSVLVIDANECPATLSILVDQPAAPLALSDAIVDVDCFGSSTGSIDLTTTGGTAGYTYDWDNDGTGDNDDTEDLSGIPAGQYNVVVTDNNGCQETLSTTVNEPALGITPSVEITSVLCFGDSTGSIDLEVIGGTQPYVYDWDNDGTGDNDDNQDIIGLPSGFYTVVVTDGNGCTQTSGGFVSQPNQALTIVPTVTEPSCFGYTDGSISLAISGGTTPYYMEWGDENQYLLNNPSELLSDLGKGLYFYRITDANGCIYEEFVDVGQPDTLDVDFTVTDVSCYGGSDGMITLVPNGGTTPYSFLWSNSSTNQDQTNLMYGEYSYVLTDANGCIFEQSIFVDQSPEIHIDQEIIPLSCIDQFDAEIIIKTAGGMQPYTWQWSNGETSEHNAGLGAGIYTVLITDDFGCTQVFEFNIQPSSIECVDPVTSFTPNGDDYNDTWIIENLYLYPNAEVRIFNRWGNLLYETIGEYIPWDGTYEGNPLPSEVYYYIIKLNNGVDNQYTGTVTIVR